MIAFVVLARENAVFILFLKDLYLFRIGFNGAFEFDVFDFDFFVGFDLALELQDLGLLLLQLFFLLNDNLLVLFDICYLLV